MVSLISVIQSGNIGIGFLLLIGFGILGYILAYKQNWIASMQRFRESMGLRYRIKTSEKTNQIESKILKVIGIILMLIGAVFFLSIVFYAVF